MNNFENHLCCGCTACAEICPRNCIEMVEDSAGFKIPKYNNEINCINCGLCEKVCPVINNSKELKRVDRAYIVQNIDDKIRKDSTSGGAFSAIAECIIERGGIVYGAAYNEQFEVVHIGVNSKRGLAKFRNSKYVQSNLNNTFIEIKELLENNALVCFSGTPCQVEGLKKFLNKGYRNLILVDVVCHGVSSPLIWKKYLELQNKYAPTNIMFRNKHYGYKYSTMSIFNEDDEIYYAGVESDPMLRAFFSNSIDRDSCYKCPFKKRYRESDVTIWDCFQPKFFDAAFDDDLGTSSLLINSETGLELFDTFKEKLKYKEVNADDLTFRNNEMVNSVKCGPNRKEILEDAINLDANKFFNKWYPYNNLQKIKKGIRLALIYSGLYRFVKYYIYLYRRKK